ncbi:MAG: rhodanese-like domain-containing protein [Acidobacteriota bacterium]|nr:rhodanese-like domain-containing protein [Acidobacteriota bacterium]
MRLLISLAAALGLSVALLAACNPQDGRVTTTTANNNTKTTAPPAPVTQLTPQPDSVRRMTVDELKAAVAKNEAVIYDVRTAETYQASHIKDAKLFVESEIDKEFSEVPKGKLIVTYCA